MIAAGLAALTLLAPAPPAPDRAAAGRGAAWIASQTASATGGAAADAVVALRAAHRPVTGPLARLRTVADAYATSPGPAAKVALAAVAAGANPRCFAGVDLVDEIRQGYADGVFGATIFDHALAIAALAAAKERVPPAAVRTLRAARRDGGYGLALTGGPDDADSTGLALMALRAAGVKVQDPAVRGAVAWLGAHHAPGGGWAGATGPVRNANSTGLALRGLLAYGRPIRTADVRALRRLQAADGSFSATAAAPGSRLLATVEAVPALLRVPLPVARRTAPARPCAR